MLGLIHRNRNRRLRGGYLTRRNALVKNNIIRATAEHLGSTRDPKKHNGGSQYHPYEDIAELTPENRGDATLTAAESSRTIIEVLHSDYFVDQSKQLSKNDF